MFCLAVFEREERNRKRLKDALLKCSFMMDMEVEILWFTTSDSVDKVSRYAQKMQIAFISLDDEAGKLGRIIYQENPDCLLCYYCEREVRIEYLLDSRPIAFYLWSGKNEELEDRIAYLIRESARENAIFNYTTKKTQLVVPLRNILYFQSDLKHVVLHCCGGREERIFGRMSDIEDRLHENRQKGFFLRIHKSFLVNIFHILKLDRSGRMIELSNHAMLPVSEAQYARISQWLEDYKSSFGL